MSEFIYIFRSFGENTTSLKFGYSKDEWSRIKQHQSSNPHLKVVYKAKLKNAFKIEQDFHKLHKAIFGLEFYPEELLPTMLEYLNQFDHEDCTDENKPKTIIDNFKNIVLDCIEGNQQTLDNAYLKYSFLQEAINKLGYKGIEQCNYQTTNVKRKLVQLSVNNKNRQVADSLINLVTLNTFYSAYDLKELLSKVYKENNVLTTAKASDIELFYKVKPKTTKINNKSVAGFVVLNALTI